MKTTHIKVPIRALKCNYNPRVPFLISVGSAIDLFGSVRFHKITRHSLAKDAKKISRDWDQIGKDLRKAIEHVANIIKNTNEKREEVREFED